VTSTISQTSDVSIPDGDINRNNLFGIPDPLPGILHLWTFKTPIF
jgi:hypothetical protein